MTGKYSKGAGLQNEEQEGALYFVIGRRCEDTVECHSLGWLEQEIIHVSSRVPRASWQMTRYYKL